MFRPNESPIHHASCRRALAALAVSTLLTAVPAAQEAPPAAPRAYVPAILQRLGQ